MNRTGEREQEHDENARKAPNEPEAIASEELRRVKESAPRTRRRNIIIVTAVVVVALVLVVYLTLRSRSQAADPPTEVNTVVSVRVAKAERQPIAAEASAIGTIFPREQAIVSSKIGGQIRQMRLLKNVVVRAGEVIAALETRDLQAQRAEAAAALNEARLNLRGVSTGAIPQASAQAERDLRDARANVQNARALYERRRALYSKGGIALKDVEAAQLALATAEANLQLVERTAALRASAINPNDRAIAASRVAQVEQRVAALDAQLSYAAIRSPITGIVTDQFQFQGEYAAVGARLLTIADISEVIIKAQFADTVVAQLQVGDRATVLPADLPGERMTGKIKLISRSSDPLNRTVEVWVNLGNGAGRLRSGGAAQVIVATKQTGDAVVVPAAAVTLDATNTNTGTVMIVDAGNVAHETKVTIGIRTPLTVQITSGLQGGETVVTEGNYALPEGTKVEINTAATGSEAGNTTGSASSAPGAAAPVTGGTP